MTCCLDTGGTVGQHQHCTQFSSHKNLAAIRTSENGSHGTGRTESRQVATPLTYFQGLRQVSVIVHINVAYALSVTHDGDVMTLILDGAHQLRGSAWDYQVYVAVQ